jgi:hypothetical protein
LSGNSRGLRLHSVIREINKMNDEKSNKEQLISKQITADTASSILTASAEGSSLSMRALEAAVARKASVLSTCLGEIEALLKRLDPKKDAIGNIDAIQSTELDAIVEKIHASPTIPTLSDKDRALIKPNINNAIDILEEITQNLPPYLQEKSKEIKNLCQWCSYKDPGNLTPQPKSWYLQTINTPGGWHYLRYRRSILRKIANGRGLERPFGSKPYYLHPFRANHSIWNIVPPKERPQVKLSGLMPVLPESKAMPIVAKEDADSKEERPTITHTVSTTSAEGSSLSMEAFEAVVAQKVQVLSGCLGKLETLLARLDPNKDAIGNIDVIQPIELDEIVEEIHASPAIPELFDEDWDSLVSIRPDISHAIFLLEDLEDNLPGYLEGVSVEIRDLYQWCYYGDSNDPNVPKQGLWYPRSINSPTAWNYLRYNSILQEIAAGKRFKESPYIPPFPNDHPIWNVMPPAERPKTKDNDPVRVLSGSESKATPLVAKGADSKSVSAPVSGSISTPTTTQTVIFSSPLFSPALPATPLSSLSSHRFVVASLGAGSPTSGAEPGAAPNAPSTVQAKQSTTSLPPIPAKNQSTTLEQVWSASDGVLPISVVAPSPVPALLNNRDVMDSAVDSQTTTDPLTTGDKEIENLCEMMDPSSINSAGNASEEKDRGDSCSPSGKQFLSRPEAAITQSHRLENAMAHFRSGLSNRVGNPKLTPSLPSSSGSAMPPHSRL